MHLSSMCARGRFLDSKLTDGRTDVKGNRERNLKKALELFEEMKNENIPMNEFIFTSLINVCDKQADLGAPFPLFTLTNWLTQC